jgi:hypothetical protein
VGYVIVSIGAGACWYCGMLVRLMYILLHSNIGNLCLFTMSIAYNWSIFTYLYEIVR